MAALNKLGGARVVLPTVTRSSAISAVIDGIGVGGKLVVVGPSMEPIQVSPMQLLAARRSTQGHAFGRLDR